MGWIDFNKNAAVADNPRAPDQDRCWALRSCCRSVASLAGHVVAAEELITEIGSLVNATVEERPGGKQVIVSHTAESLKLLRYLRGCLLSQLHVYDARRRILKRSGKRFPVARPFTHDGVLQTFAALAPNSAQ